MTTLLKKTLQKFYCGQASWLKPTARDRISFLQLKVVLLILYIYKHLHLKSTLIMVTSDLTRPS